MIMLIIIIGRTEGLLWSECLVATELRRETSPTGFVRRIG